MNEGYILSLDQGTTSSRAILFDHSANLISMGQKEFTQIYPHTGWVEHDPEEIWESQVEVMRDVIEKSGIGLEEIKAIGITNQRETTVVWDKITGKPVTNAIVWQCRRTSDICEELKSKGLESYIRSNTGLVVDAYFSATKLMWVLENIDDARERAERGELLFGTIDTWLIWKLTGGKVHATDYSNASRTMLFNIKDLEWDEFLLDHMNIPKSLLPEVRGSSDYYGNIISDVLGAEIPITGVAGDQQSALFGQACFTPGDVKNTYGTGCFMLMNTGETLIHSKNGLLTTIAWHVDGETIYALEGSIFMAGAVIQWLRDELGLIKSSGESEELAKAVEDTGGVYLVPAFAGLGAPYWDMYARGTITGLTRGTRKEHIVRAGLESIAYQTKDVLIAMEEDSGIRLKTVRVDGGAVVNDFLMQFQADILNVEVIRPLLAETTALGAAYLAGLQVGFWKDRDEIIAERKTDNTFVSSMTPENIISAYNGWVRAVERSSRWEQEGE